MFLCKPKIQNTFLIEDKKSVLCQLSIVNISKKCKIIITKKKKKQYQQKKIIKEKTQISKIFYSFDNYPVFYIRHFQV